MCQTISADRLVNELENVDRELKGNCTRKQKLLLIYDTSLSLIIDTIAAVTLS